jgi:Family of unknown function (DUF7009)
MKLRFRGNSVRLRLNQSEVRKLAAGNALEEQVHFPDSAPVSYALLLTPDGPAQASFREGAIRVLAPENDVRQWAASDSIGLYFELPANGTVLTIAIEKDLDCTDGRPEERDPDAFPRSQPKSC